MPAGTRSSNAKPTSPLGVVLRLYSVWAVLMIVQSGAWLLRPFAPSSGIAINQVVLCFVVVVVLSVPLGLLMFLKVRHWIGFGLFTASVGVVLAVVHGFIQFMTVPHR